MPWPDTDKDRVEVLQRVLRLMQVVVKEAPEAARTEFAESIAADLDGASEYLFALDMGDDLIAAAKAADEEAKNV